jgi:hypothetical protein
VHICTVHIPQNREDWARSIFVTLLNVRLHMENSSMEAKAFSAHLSRFFAQLKPLAIGEKKTNIIILKSEINWGL